MYSSMAGARSCSPAWSPLSGWVPGNLMPTQSKLVRRVSDPPHTLSFHPGALGIGAPSGRC